MTVRLLERPDAVRCEAILRALPEWFGLEDAIVQYRKDIEAMETFGAFAGGVLAGFLTLRRHFAESFEIQVMAVLREHHGRGLGKALVRHAEEALRARGAEYLQVKTLSASRPDASYEKTRGFYVAMGFRPLEEFPALWHPANPCLLMVKRL